MQNLVKNFFSSSKGSPDNQSQYPRNDELAVTHLNKVYQNYVSNQHQLEPVLPLFCKAFKSARAAEIAAKFPAISEFSGRVAKELVTNVTLTASSKSLEDGSISLFYLIKGKHWNSLCSINIASLSSSAVKEMCNENLPSTLVKMLYMFMDLPDSVTSDNMFNAASDMLMSILIRIGEHVCVSEELRSAGDLTVLFDISTSVWPVYMLPWQRCAIEFLATICRKSLNQGLMSYLLEEKTIQLCIQNIVYYAEAYIFGITEVVLPFFGYLKDSCSVSDVLLLEFQKCNGYTIIVDIIVKLHRLNTTDVRRSESIKKLLYSIPLLCTAGYTQPEIDISGSLMEYQRKDFTMPTYSTNGGLVKNSDAFLVLKESFLRISDDEYHSTLILDVITQIFKMDEINYFILLSYDTINAFISKVLKSTTFPIQERILKLVEHVVFVLDFIPAPELESLSNILRDSPPPELGTLILSSFNKIITADVQLKEVLLKIGLLNSLQFCQIEILQSCHAGNEISESYMTMLITTLTTMLEDCYPCYQLYVEQPAKEYLYDMIHIPVFRSYVLHTIKTLVTYNTEENDEIRSLLRIVQENPTDTELKLDIIDCLTSLLHSFSQAQTMFRHADGFLFLSTILVSCENNTHYKKVIGATFRLLQAVLHNNPANIYYFTYNLNLDGSLTQPLKLLKCFTKASTESDPGLQFKEIVEVLRLLLSLALNQCDVPAKELSLEQYIITYPRIIKTILELTVDTQNDHVIKEVCHWFIRLCGTSERNRDVLCNIGVLPFLLSQFTDMIIDQKHECHVTIITLFELLARHKINPHELWVYLRLDNPLYCKRVEHVTSKLEQQTPLPVVDDADIINGQLLDDNSDLANNDEDDNKKDRDSPQVTVVVSDTSSRTTVSTDGIALKEDTEDTTDTELEGSKNLDLSADTEGDVDNYDGLATAGGDHDEDYVYTDLLPDPANLAAERPPPSPVVISMEEIERLKVENAINYTSLEEEAAAQEEEEEMMSSYEVIPEFTVKVIAKHYIELLVSVSTPVDGQQSSATFHQIDEGCYNAGFVIPYILPPDNTATEKMFQSAFTLSFWYCIPKLQSKSDSWEVNLLHHKNIKISLFKGKVSVHCGEVIHTSDCNRVDNDDEWHNLVFTFTKGTKIKSSSVDVYFDRIPFFTYKIDFPAILEAKQMFEVGMCSDKKPNVTWKLGGFLLWDGVLTHKQIHSLNQLGVEYVGNFYNVDGIHTPIINISPSKSSIIMWDNVVKILSTEAGESLRKLFKVTLSDSNCTPVRIFPNIASHVLSLDTVPYGIAYYCNTPITPLHIDQTIDTIGGVYALLGLVAMSEDSEGLYAAIKLLALLVSNNGRLRSAMQDDGYYILALLLHRKSNTISTHVLQLLVSMGTSNGRIIDNMAIERLLFWFEIWRYASIDIQAQLFTCINNLVNVRDNIQPLIEMGLMEKILEFIFDGSNPMTLIQSTLDAVSSIISLKEPRVLKVFGQYLLYTLPKNFNNEHKIQDIAHLVRVRNMLLELLCVLVQSDNFNNDNTLLTQVEEVLGFDWVLMFLRPGLHHITFTMALRLFSLMIAPQNGFARFTNKQHHHGWQTSLPPPEKDSASYHGFTLLLHTLKGHTRLSEFSNYSAKLYTWLISLTLNQSSLPISLSCTFDSASLIREFEHVEGGMLNKDPLVVMLSIIRDELEDANFDAIVTFLAHIYHTCELTQTVYVTLVELFIGLLTSPYMITPGEFLVRRQVVFDLLQQVVIQELTKQNNDILESVFEPCIVDLKDDQVKYESHLLIHILEGFVTAATKNQTPSKNFSKALVFYSKYISRKLWLGKLGISTQILTNFIRLVTWAKGNNEVCVMGCLQRSVLYLLSTQSPPKTTIKLIHFIEEHHKEILKPDNLEVEFVICLAHLLRSLPTDSDWGPIITQSVASLLNLLKGLRSDMPTYVDQNSEIPVVMFKTSLKNTSNIITISNGKQVVVQYQVAPHLFGAIKQQVEDEEKSYQNKPTARRFTGLLTSRRQENQLTVPISVALSISCEIDYDLSNLAITAVGESMRESVQSTQLRFNRTLQKWTEIQMELTQERGLWGPCKPTHLDRWELNPIEGPHRTRKRLSLNTSFYKSYQPKSVQDYRITKLRQPSSAYSREYYQYYGNRDRVSSLTTIGNAGGSGGSAQRGGDDGEEEEKEEKQELPDRPLTSHLNLDPDNKLLNAQLREGEIQVHVYPCIRVSGLSTFASLLYLGKRSAYIIDGYTLTRNTNEIVDIQMLMVEEWWVRFSDILIDSKDVITTNRAVYMIAYNEISQVLKRRYSLQNNAIEIFCDSGNSYFVVFGHYQRNKAYHKIKHLSPSLNAKSDYASDVISSAARRQNDNSSLLSKFTPSNVTQRWQNGEITNFQYLMYINTLAGRSYNDLMQYPIFPWVIADYESEVLDFTNPKTFRDLSKPMGAQTPPRLKQFQKRYADWVDPHGTDSSPCHYGTFYSSAMITSSYLIRLEPFTSFFIQLQGGHFDLADRLFYSIKDAWKSASEINMCDVRELIPEFFFLPDFLTNSNKFHFGRKQSGENIDSVELPVWAKGCPQEFIRINREALESDYVSKNLHHWIDLIFGYKQRGNEAVKANNTFHCYFYEGYIDVTNLTDPLRKSAVKGFINNFGQAPKQIFTKPHAVRNIKYSDLVASTFHYNVNNLKPPLKEERTISTAVAQVQPVEGGGVLFVGRHKALIPPSNPGSNYNYYVTWGHPDNSLHLCSIEGKTVQIYENVEKQAILTVICPDSGTVITAGSYNYISVWCHKMVPSRASTQLSVLYSSNTTKVLQPRKKLYGHTDRVRHLVASNNFRIFLSGSDDQTVILWDLNEFRFIRQLPKHPHAITALNINDLSGCIVTASHSSIFIWDINGTIITRTLISGTPNLIFTCITQTSIYEWDNNNVIVTGSNDGIVRIWGWMYKENSTNKTYNQTMVIRSKLTMHTSFSRHDNRKPAEITCVRFSETHDSLYVGDERGRVFCWRSDDSSGQLADHWVLDSGAKECKQCKVTFTFVERRHHCRNCGNVFCSGCSNYQHAIPYRNIQKKVRVCKNCYQNLRTSVSSS